MNFYGTETTEQHSISGRLIPLGEALLLAVERAGGQPVQEPRYSQVLPAWGHNLCAKLTTTIFRNMVEIAPKDNQFVARHYGQLIGVLLRAAVFFLKDAPALLKREGLWDLTKEQEAKLDKMSGLPLLFSVASEKFQKPVSNGDQLVEVGLENAGEKATHLAGGFFLVLRYLLDRPVQEQYEFLRGIPEGFKAFLNFKGEFVGDKRRLENYVLLAMYWPEIAEMQKEQPPKTRKLLLEWLEKQEGTKNWLRTPKYFTRFVMKLD